MSLLDPRVFFRATGETVGLLTRHKKLLWEMVRRDIADRYVGHFFGLFWAVGHPLIIMAVFLFLFGAVFKARTAGIFETPFGYAVYLLSGLVPFISIQEPLMRGPTAITSNIGLVRQVVFPLEVLPVKMVLASQLHLLISLAALVLYSLIVYQFLPWTYVLLPLLVFLLLILMTGLSYILASVGVFFKDTKEFVQIFIFVGLYTSPILFLPQWVPSALKPILYLNPLSYLVWCFQDVCYFGAILHPYAWLVLIVVSFAALLLGGRMFNRLKVHFGNFV